MREACSKLRQQAHIHQCFMYSRLPLFPIQVFLGAVEAFGDNVIHLGPLIEGGHRILEYHLDFSCYPPIEIFIYLAGNTLAIIDDFAAAGLVHPDDGTAYGCLTRA